MRKVVSIGILLVAVLYGCATPRQIDQSKMAYAQSIQPVCRGERECELMWSAAKQWVEDNSHYQIKLLTVDHLETHSPTGGSSWLGMAISKVPNKDGSYRLRSRMWCDNMFGCNPEPEDALIALNKAVNAAK